MDFDYGDIAKAKSKKLEPPPDIPYHDLDSRFVQAWIGLICLVFKDTNRVIIWNPATHKHREVPQQFEWRHEYGFGYDYKSEDYKLVVLKHASDEEESETCSTVVHVYSLKSDLWGPSHTKDGLQRLAYDPVNISGALYYVSREEPLERILAFDMATEEWRMVPPPPMPPGPTGNDIFIILSKHRESLCASWHDVDDDRFDFWATNNEGINNLIWIKLFTIKNTHNDITGRKLLTHIWSLKKMSQRQVLIHDGEGLMLYNVDKETIEDFRAFEVSAVFKVITCYNESLVRV